MKLSLVLLSITTSSSGAFVHSTSRTAPVALASSSESAAVDTETSVVAEPVVAAAAAAASAPLGPTINGWTPDASKPCYGLPGAIEPLGFFDPLDFSVGKDLSEVKRLREAEVLHGRVAMMATVGYLIGENTPTILYHGKNFAPTIANNQLAEVPMSILFPFFLLINFAEAWRTANGFVEPTSQENLFKLREGYYPGDIGFDPLSFKPKDDPAGFAALQTRELSNGRLAMIAVAGMCVQELATGQPLFGY